MGSEGSLVYTDASTIAVPSISVDVVDTTGAGDAFNSGLAVALADGMDLEASVRFANCAGALACTKLGVIPSLADWAAVQALFDHNL